MLNEFKVCTELYCTVWYLTIPVRLAKPTSVVKRAVRAYEYRDIFGGVKRVQTGGRTDIIVYHFQMYIIRLSSSTTISLK